MRYTGYILDTYTQIHVSCTYPDECMYPRDPKSESILSPFPLLTCGGARPRAREAERTVPVDARPPRLMLTAAEHKCLIERANAQQQ